MEAHLSVCGMKLERMLDVLKDKRIVFYNESINTTKEPDRPPVFINLNASPAKRTIPIESTSDVELEDEQKFKDDQRESIHSKQESREAKRGRRTETNWNTDN